ncbi:MAG: AAA family ATPase [Alphaproteobacteria bacterium]|nr:AAA family ATPase [Alphaproteobacteria bacterium]MDA8001801.1 AAA family ATPase [Alphaproteobacteria bacterium]MDA8009453.1 AAA family ATPase [Alphaproteobacteria bacterium]MDA8030239.1 AAA family ATPase [Alphaproteobacteria bacterium]
MKIESIKIKNFRALYDVELRNVPPLAVFVGENGSGKSTLFRVFRFLKNALKDNVTIAVQHEGGYKEMATRGRAAEPISFEIKFRTPITGKDRLVTYKLEIAADKSGTVVQREILRYKRGSYGSPYHFLDFAKGKGYAINNEEDFSKTDEELTKEYEVLDSPDLLAIKGLGQFQRFKAASAFRNLIENWHVSDFHIQDARHSARAGVAKHLSESGDNLPLVTQTLYQNDRKTFEEILKKFQERIPGMSEVKPHVTEDGYVLLRFKDGTFKDPFIAEHVSDGTIKMFAYLVLLHDPKPHPFLCIEEPENQLYPNLLSVLMEELRDYAMRGGQVFVSTHSPDMLNEVEIEEAFLLKKAKGITSVYPLCENEQITELIDGGDKLGWLWRNTLLEKLL